MPRTGRPRQFDRAEAVRRAMGLFWERGYDGASLAELRAAMGGLSSASVYAAFGSKEGLFRAVAAEYLRTHGRVTAPLADRLVPPRAAVERTLRASARMQTDPAHPAGCLVVSSVTACSPANRRVGELMAVARDRNRRGLRSCVRRAVRAGELPADTGVAALAAVFDTFLVGLSAQARDRVSAATLDAAITQLLGLWDALAAGVGSRSTVLPGRPAAISPTSPRPRSA